MLLRRLKQLELIEEKPYVTITQKGWDFKGFDHIRHTKYEQKTAQNLVQENLRLQNENLVFQNSSGARQKEIDKLTIENLKLQNKQIRNYIFYSISAFLTGAILTNFKEIWSFIKTIIV